MQDEANQDEQALLAQLREARERLDALAGELRAVDAELEGLATDRQRHRLLHDACSALEELDGLGGARLFWGDRAAGAEAGEHLRGVRHRVDTFQKQLREIEDRREALIEEIQVQEEGAELLEDDVFEARREAEQRKLDWVIERDISPGALRPATMPWAREGEDDSRFRSTLALSLLLGLLLGLVFPQITLPLPDPWEPAEVPERLARLIREELPPPPPPPPAREQAKPEELEPEPSEKTASQPAPKATPEEGSASKGILAFREKLSGIAESDPADRLGARARIRGPGESAHGRPQRSMVATQAAGSSGGINLGGLSRDVGGGGGEAMEGVRVTRATSSIGRAGETDRPLSEGPGPARTDEEIQIVFDRHKAALYRLYNRELRRDPTLKGQMLLRIRIEPDGRVSLCDLQSTDMQAPQLVAQVLERVRTFDFGAKEVPPVTILYPIDFLPAS